MRIQEHVRLFHILYVAQQAMTQVEQRLAAAMRERGINAFTEPGYGAATLSHDGRVTIIRSKP